MFRKNSQRLVILCMTGLLYSCSSINKDGPPDFYVDETQIPNAIPKPEPLARYGNKPYNVFGKHYNVLSSSRYYQATGTASWYGTKFHHRKTSSGEPYDMLAMTAAHKTLPLPTYVEVTNLKNGQKVIVKVNDRGPFVGDRLIDLSYVAAKKLGVYGHGTAPVRIRAIDVYHPYAAAPAITPTVTHARLPTPTPHTYQANTRQSTSVKAIYVQVGAFKEQHNAINLRKRLSKLTSFPVIIANSVQPLYKVRIGPIYNPQLAKQLMAQLLKIGFRPQMY